MSVVEVRVCGRYKLGQKMGNGSFGSIFFARNVQTNQEVLIKSEEIKSKHPQLLFEGKIFQSLQGGIGIPNMHWCGQEGDFNFLVLEQTGQNLEELFSLCGRKFSLKTVLMIADKMISNFEYFHYKHYIHRDIKPENFVVGIGKKSKNIYIVDFGLAKKYRDSTTYEHIPFREKKPLISSARYASLNAHKGYEISRRDDMESLLYMFIYFLNGSLPWQGVQANKKEEKYNKIKDIKNNLSIEEICAGLPLEFSIYLKYIRQLQFEEKVDYTYLKKIFKERFIKEGFEFDYVYDWVLIPLIQRAPNINARIPIAIELLSNEEELYRPQEETIASNNLLDKDFSPQDVEIYQQQQWQNIQQQQNPFPVNFDNNNNQQKEINHQKQLQDFISNNNKEINLQQQQKQKTNNTNKHEIYDKQPNMQQIKEEAETEKQQQANKKKDNKQDKKKNKDKCNIF